jgi:hypothetical protein
MKMPPRNRGRRRIDSALPAIVVAMSALALVAIVLAIISQSTASGVESNTTKLEKSLCAEIHYLENVASNPGTNAVNRRNLRRLVHSLRRLQPECPPVIHVGL